MKYGIGLDIGITSVGWAVMALDENETPYKIDNLGCRIFDLAQHPKDGSSLALPRRTARGARRRLRRRRHRLDRIKHYLIDNNLIYQDELDNLYSTTTDVYMLRAKALDELISKEEFIRVLLHIAKRRGFKSNRRTENEKKDEGNLLGSISANADRMSKNGYRTIGEMLYKDHAFAEAKRNKGGEYLNCATRQMIEDEVRLVFKSQNDLGNPLATNTFCEDYLSILLSQRSFDEGPGAPSPYAGNQIEKMLRNCTFEQTEKRAAKAEYHTQYFTLLENINHLKIAASGSSRFLTTEEREIVKNLAFSGSTLTFDKIRKTLNLSDNEYFTVLNYGDKPKSEVESKAKFEFLKAYHKIKSACKKISPTAFSSLSHDDLDEIGRVLSFYKSEENARCELNKLNISEPIIDSLLDLSFSGTSHLSRKAYKKIIPNLEKGMKYSDACEAAGYNFRGHNADSKNKLLPTCAAELDDITNPVVRRAVSQTIKVVNSIIRNYGTSPIYINVELARELSKDIKERRQIEKEMADNRSKNDAIMTRLKTEFHLSNPSGQDLVKFKLWQEQDGKCAYSLDSIPAERLFEPGYADIDHIIPYSMCFDDSYNNKVIVKSYENRVKSNRLPLQYLSGEKRDAFVIWVNNTIRNIRKRQNLLKPAFTAEDEKQFIERNLNDTKYISRFMLNYIRDYLEFAPSDTGMKKRVRSVNGAVTSYLRKRWGITKVREDGDAHHIVDAAVIANVTDSTIKRVTEYSKRRELRYTNISLDGSELIDDRTTGELVKNFPLPWHGFRDEIIIRSEYADPASAIQHKRLPNYSISDIDKVQPVFVSRMPKHKVTGAAHKDTIKSPKSIDSGVVIVKRALTDLKLDKNGEIANYHSPESDPHLYNALKSRLAQFNGDGSIAFKDFVFRKPKKDGTPGPIVKKVQIEEKSNLFVPVQGGNGVADNDTMVRVDVFKVEGDGYYWVPIYVADTLKPKLPNKASVANKPYSEWKEMRDKDFIFSLYPNDIIKIRAKKSLTFKTVNKDSTLPAEKTDNDCLVYFISAGISVGSFSVITHDKTYTVASLGVKTLESLEKYQVDILGNVSKVGKEKRMGFGG